jgi:hypothetical protein
VWSQDAVLQRTAPLDLFTFGGLLAARIVPEVGVSANGVRLPRTGSVMAPRYALSRHAQTVVGSTR